MTENHIWSVCGERKLLAIMPTPKCPASCKDCGSSYNRNDIRILPDELIVRSIEQAKDLNFTHIAFTGGEATLEWEKLLLGIETAKKNGLSTRLITNAHWADNIHHANNKIDELLEKGLDEINISTGDEHSKYIPISNVINAIVSAMEKKLKTHVVIEYRAGRKISQSTVIEKLNQQNISEIDQISVTESPWMPIHPLRKGSYLKNDTLNNDNFNLREGCKSVLQSYSIQSDGRIGACCGLGMDQIPELYVGNIDSTTLKKAIEEAEGDFFKLWLRYIGPEKIIVWASSLDPSIKWQNRYAHKCQICHRIYSDDKIRNVIINNHEKLFSEVICNLIFDEISFHRMMLNNKLLS